jgi:hypothetical protein
MPLKLPGFKAVCMTGGIPGKTAHGPAFCGVTRIRVLHHKDGANYF